jgi:hypothetical protein
LVNNDDNNQITDSSRVGQLFRNIGDPATHQFQSSMTLEAKLFNRQAKIKEKYH